MTFTSSPTPVVHRAERLPSDGRNVFQTDAAPGDLIVIGTLALPAFVLTAHLDFFERFAASSRRHEGWQIDEFFSLAVILPCALAVFSYRRWTERRRAEDDLRSPLVLTTTDDPREIEHCYERGCGVYVAKPVKCERFSEAVRRPGMLLQDVQVPVEV